MHLSDATNLRRRPIRSSASSDRAFWCADLRRYRIFTMGNRTWLAQPDRPHKRGIGARGATVEAGTGVTRGAIGTTGRMCYLAQKRAQSRTASRREMRCPHSGQGWSSLVRDWSE